MVKIFQIFVREWPYSNQPREHRNVRFRFKMFFLNDFDQDFRLKMGRKWRYFDITIKITDNLNFFLFVSRSAGQIW